MLEEIFDTLRGIVRRLSGRAESPSLRIIDSRSVRTSHHIDGQRGIDGNKKIKGRKEHIVVDTLGLPMSVRVHPANVHDSVVAEEVFESMRYKFPGLIRTRPCCHIANGWSLCCSQSAAIEKVDTEG